MVTLGLHKAPVDVCCLLIITISLIQFGRSAHANFGGRNPYYARTGVRKVQVIVPFCRALVVFIDCPC